MDNDRMPDIVIISTAAAAIIMVSKEESVAVCTVYCPYYYFIVHGKDYDLQVTEFLASYLHVT
jgi:hypothetical protein